MPIFNQSDFGYTVGGLEYRDRDVCVAKQAQCLKLAAQYEAAGTDITRHYAAKFGQQAEDWQREIDWYSTGEWK